MIKRLAIFAAPAAALVMMVTAGCAKQSPAIGTWTATSPTGKGATVTLAKDGTGTFSVPPMMNNKPIKWTEEEKKVTLSIESSMPGAAGGGAGAPSSSLNLNSTISEDGKTMTVTLPMASLTFTKQEK
jgi:hypothetical protein